MRKFKAKKFALLNDKQAFGQGVTEVAKATIEKAGGSVTSSGGVEPKDVDYSAVLTKIIKTENPDAIVYCTNFNTSAGLLVKQVRAARLQEADRRLRRLLRPRHAQGGRAPRVTRSRTPRPCTSPSRPRPTPVPARPTR